jgi:hypothetical protein
MPIDGPPAIRCATPANHPLAILSELIIVGQFLSPSNLPQTNQPEPLSNSSKRQVWIATMVNEFGTIPVHSSVDGPIGVKLREIVEALTPAVGSLEKPFPGLAPGDPFARIFNHSAAPWDLSTGKHTQAMNSGASHM